MQTPVRLFLISTSFAAIFFSAQPVFADPYGAGNYGAGAYGEQSAPSSTPTPTPIQSEPTNTPVPTNTPTPTPPVCSLTSAVWDTQVNPVTEGNLVILKVTGSTECIGKQVAFEVWENDSVLEGIGDDPAVVQPDGTTFDSTGTATAMWIAEWQNDCGGFCLPPEYFFNASLVENAGITIRSADPLLEVNPNIPPPTPTPTPTSIPTPTQVPTNTPTPTNIPTPTPQGVNLVQNPSFETLSNGFPFRWQQRTNLSSDATVFHTGQKALKVTGTANGATFAHNLPALNPSTTYTLSGWVKTQGVATSAGLKLRYPITAGTVDNSVITNPGITGTTDWTRVQKTFTTAVDYSAGRLDLLYNVNAGATAWYDDVALCVGIQACL